MATGSLVGNLSDDTSKDKLHNRFSEVGVIASCNLITDRATDRSKGFGFIEMHNDATAQAAKEEFNGPELHERALNVDEAKLERNKHEHSGAQAKRHHRA